MRELIAAVLGRVASPLHHQDTVSRSISTPKKPRKHWVRGFFVVSRCLRLPLGILGQPAATGGNIEGNSSPSERVAPAGGKWWRLKYRVDGKEKRLSLGVYPDVSLAGDDWTCTDISRTSDGHHCDINPANGLPMVGGCGGLDIEGNPYGIDFSHDDSSIDSNWDG